MFNDFILTNSFKIMPYVFIYDILVLMMVLYMSFYMNRGMKFMRYTLDLEELR